MKDVGNDADPKTEGEIQNVRCADRSSRRQWLTWSPFVSHASRFTFAALLFAALTASAQPAESTADAGAPATSPADDRLEELDQRQRVLERKLELDKEKAAEKSKEAPQFSVGEKGFSFKSADGAFKIRLRGLLQADVRAYPGDDQVKGTDTLLLRRVRPYLEATFLDLVDVRLMPDFGQGTTVLFDAWADVRVCPGFKLRLGKFKPPIGLERLQSASSITFIERALPTSLVPNRDLGLLATLDVLKGFATLELGVFNGVVDGGNGDADTNDAKDTVARLTLRPLALLGDEDLPVVSLGFAFSYGRQNGTATATNLPSLRSSGQLTWFSYASDAVANGGRLRLAPQLWASWGPVGLLAEYVRSAQDVQRGAEISRLAHAGYTVQLSYVLFGGKAAYDGAQVKKAFSFKEGQAGAVELAARYHALALDEATFPTFADPARAASGARSYGVAANWYLSSNLRVALDYERTDFTGGAADGANRESENDVLARFQVNF